MDDPVKSARKPTPKWKLCLLIVLIALALSGCSRSATDTFTRMNKVFGLSWPKGTQPTLIRTWSYRTALEGMSSTKVILAKVVLTEQQYHDFCLLNKERVAPFHMDERPPELRQYSTKYAWWDLAQYDSYSYFGLEPLPSEGTGNLRAFITSTRTNYCIFLVSHTK